MPAGGVEVMSKVWTGKHECRGATCGSCHYAASGLAQQAAVPGNPNRGSCCLAVRWPMLCLLCQQQHTGQACWHHGTVGRLSPVHAAARRCRCPCPAPPLPAPCQLPGSCRPPGRPLPACPVSASQRPQTPVSRARYTFAQGLSPGAPHCKGQATELGTGTYSQTVSASDSTAATRAE